MDNSMEINRKNFMNYIHKEFKKLFYGFLCIVLGALGLIASCWILQWIFDGPYRRIPLVMFLLPLIMIIVIGYGVCEVFRFPFRVRKKSKIAKFLKTEEGRKLLADFAGSYSYFKNEVRVGKIFFYKENDDFYPFDKIELFKLEKNNNYISIMFKIKNEKEQCLVSFTGDGWRNNKNSVIYFFDKIKTEHPEIPVEI